MALSIREAPWVSPTLFPLLWLICSWKKGHRSLPTGNYLLYELLPTLTRFFFFFLKKNINNPEHTFLMICFLRCLSLSEKMNFCIFCSFLMIFSCKSASLHVCFTILFTMPSVTKSGMLSHIHQTNAKKTFFLKWVLKGIKRSRQVAYFITIRLKPFQYLTAQCI